MTVSTVRILDAEQSIVDLSRFPGACDCHVHIFGDPRNFPYDDGRVFTPGQAPISALQQHMATIGTSRAVIVQPSVYGTDNSCIIDALQQLGPNGRGICVIGEETTQAEIRNLVEANVKGVRINFRTFGERDEQALESRLTDIANRVSALGWHVQIYSDRTMLRAINRLVSSLRIPLVLDHFADVRLHEGEEMDQLVRLMETGQIYLKLSAPHRVSDEPHYEAAANIVRKLVPLFPDRLLWGSDWPHPGAAPGQKRVKESVEPFRPEDDGAALQRLMQWVGDEVALQKILVSNPQELYDFPAI